MVYNIWGRILPIFPSHPQQHTYPMPAPTSGSIKGTADACSVKGEGSPVAGPMSGPGLAHEILRGRVSSRSWLTHSWWREGD